MIKKAIDFIGDKKVRQSLVDLINKTIVFQYSLGDLTKNIDKTVLTTTQDDCYISANNDDLVKIIYNSLIEYACNEFEIKPHNLQNLHYQALQNRIRYNEKHKQLTKIKYGFYGEALLQVVLNVFYGSETLIAKGYFYNPTENSEAKGYDLYHLIENNDQVELWFGEVKFRESFSSAVKSAIEGLEKAITDNYFDQNLLAIFNRKNDMNKQNAVFEAIRDAWESNPLISITSEAKKHNIKLVYPILIIYKNSKVLYDDKIKDAIEHINSKYSRLTHSMRIQFEIFFVFLPLDEVKSIKEEVLTWIELKKPLMQ